MIHQQANQVKVVTFKINAITCDRCHKPYADELDIQEFHHIRFQGGFMSPFGDGSNIEADICAPCLLEMLGGFYRVVQKHKDLAEPQPMLSFSGLANCWCINSTKPTEVRINPQDAVDLFQRDIDALSDLYQFKIASEEGNLLGEFWGAPVVLDPERPPGEALLLYPHTQRSLTYSRSICMDDPNPKQSIAKIVARKKNQKEARIP